MKNFTACFRVKWYKFVLIYCLLPDKLKRTALTHAVMNGHTTVASYLLYLGADPNRADSSGNTLIHYAAGYGWQYCVKLLLDAGADPKKPNDWKVSFHLNP